MSLWAEKNEDQFGRASRPPSLRCGLCDEPFEVGEKGRLVEDERCHVDCARAWRDGDALGHDDRDIVL